MKLNTTNFFVFIFNVLLIVGLNAQNNSYKAGLSNLLNAPNPEDIGVRTASQIKADSEDPLEYGYVDDNDIVWSTTVWEVIDLDERVNFPLLYPTDTFSVGNERRPMLWWLRQEIEKGAIPVYDSEGGDYFIKKLNDIEIEDVFRQKFIYTESEGYGADRQNNGYEEIQNLVYEQEELFGFNPYEESLSDDEMIQIQSRPNFIKVFPYQIKREDVAEYFDDGIITYQGFLDYDTNYFDLPTDIQDQWVLVLSEMVEELLFVEDEDYEWIEVEYAELRQWLIKGVWYFDKKYSELIYRPIAIAPVINNPDLKDRESDEIESDEDEEKLPTAEDLLADGPDSDGDGISDNNEESGDYGDLDANDPDSDGDGLNDGFEVLRGLYPDDSDSDGDGTMDGEEITNNTDPLVAENEIELEEVDDTESVDDESVAVQQKFKVLFWIYYPHAREILKRGQAFNTRNMTQSVSFDEIINSRRFSGVIYKEENVYENREVKDYMNNNSFMRLLESERIKEKIRNFEHDMWSW